MTTLHSRKSIDRLPLWRRVVLGALAACLLRPCASSSSRQSNAPDQLRSLSDNEGFHGKSKVMERQRLKIILRLGVALLVLAGWSATATAQWTPLTSPGVALDTCLLLTDGTVMCHQTYSNSWHRLTPNINGSYVNGTWSNLAPMPNGTDTSNVNGTTCAPCTYAPKYFASQVLADGRVVVIGGEYNTNSFATNPATPVWTNIGFLFDPTTTGGLGSWSTQLTGAFPTGTIGDAQSVVLANGRMILANITSGNIELFDPATLTFTALNPPGKVFGDINDQENWNILPDGRVLTVDAWIQTSSEIYNPATNSWGTAGSTMVNLADTGGGPVGNSHEVGPGVLRPDGTLIYFSGNPLGQNAVYDTNTGTWSHTAAMDFPIIGGNQYSVADGPASLLPNGNVLVMASPPIPGSANYPFNPPSHFFEFDGTNLTEVNPGPNADSLASFEGRFLLLPTGEVLFTSEPNTDVSVYSNGGGPQDAWRPVITTAPCQVAAGNTYSISGTLFNGFSEGASYGDDAQSSTNYPLVRIENHATNPPHVFYARTHDHSRMGVEAVGSSEIVTTQFDVPLGLESGPSDLIVVVNGIASLPVQVNLNGTADLAITKTDSPDPVIAGNNLTYTVTVTNNGPDTATSVIVTDDLPAETTFVSCSSTGVGVCGGSGNNRTVTFASLASGESEIITFVATVNCSVADGTVISNTATVSSCTSDPNSNNNSATTTTTASNPPPTITGASANPSVLWPPNHRMVNVTVSYEVTDNCALSPDSCTLSVTSNEPVNGQGDGNTFPDWIILDAHHVLLRAERAGNGNGRIYTITITCVDSGGNSSSRSVTVTVPHDRGRR
jgi:uncharacterized repeat protein (TIGR01451 family)